MAREFKFKEGGEVPHQVNTPFGHSYIFLPSLNFTLKIGDERDCDWFAKNKRFEEITLKKKVVKAVKKMTSKKGKKEEEELEDDE